MAAAFLLAYPVYVIRPFQQQGARELEWALAITRYRPGFEILLAAAAAACAIFGWCSGARRAAKIGAAACALVAIGCLFLSRINIYELLFHPLDRATFSRASQSKLDSGEEVIAVKIGSEARAYPVRDLSYHHIVNDALAGGPIVATY